MQQIIIINDGDITVEQAKNDLLSKMYHCRYKTTLGGYEMWLELLQLYYAFDYVAMVERIAACKGMGGKTRSECITLLKIIMGV